MGGNGGIKGRSSGAVEDGRVAHPRASNAPLETPAVLKLAFAIFALLASIALASHALASSLNPQPLPPCWAGPHLPPHPEPVPVVRF